MQIVLARKGQLRVNPLQKREEERYFCLTGSCGDLLSESPRTVQEGKRDAADMKHRLSGLSNKDAKQAPSHSGGTRDRKYDIDDLDRGRLDTLRKT